ncbi:MAG: glycerol kinase [Planctomycetes bacterium]|nr:glycerol kinase [Planctomycetota bacterium]
MWLALDQGSTSSGAALVDDRGRIRRLARVAVATRHPAPGHVEIDAEAALRTLEEAARRIGAPRTVDGVGLASQRSTVVLWDRRTGRPVAPALSWQDVRGARVLAAMRIDASAIRRTTGLVPSPHYSAVKMKWLLDRVAGARQRARSGRYAIGTLNAFLVFRLTRGRVFATDPTHAQRTLLFDVRRGDWDDDLLRRFGVPRAALPEVRPSFGEFGSCDFGPIRACAGDQQAAFVGLAPARREAIVNYGTGAFFVIAAGSSPASSRGLLSSVLPTPRRSFAVEGTVNAAGAALDWMGRALRLFGSPGEMKRLLRDRATDVRCLPAPEGLGAPFFDPSARTRFVGIDARTTPGDLVFATLEGIAALVSVIADRARGSGARATAAVAAGGLSKLDDLLQLQADFLGVPVRRARVREATLLGAAALARGVAFPRDVDAETVFKPTGGTRDADRRLGAWMEAVGLRLSGGRGAR